MFVRGYISGSESVYLTKTPIDQVDSEMSIHNSVVAVYLTHTEADEAVKELQLCGVDMHQLSIIGYMDHGTTTTPFDMVVLNEMSRFHLALDALKHIPRLRQQPEYAINFFNQEL